MRLFAAVGETTLVATRGVGMVALVFGRTLLHLPRLEWREFWRGMLHFGVNSLPLTLGVATVTGATVVVQSALYVQRFGARQYLGWAAGYAVLWEMGPLLLGLMMAGRVGARNAAELATLTVGGQLEGLRGISLDPFRLLVAPRVLAIVVSLMLLSTIAMAVALWVEASAAAVALDLPRAVFFGSFDDMIRLGDLIAGGTKTAAFGLAIALVSTATGLSAAGGARAVGNAAASAVVRSAAAIFTLDLLLTPLLASVLT